MSPQQFIKSGKLEKYVLGIASKSEEREVKQFCRQYPLVRQQLIKLRKSMNSYIKKQKVIPPRKGVIRQIISRISRRKFM
ncbi:MAG: hypothetical protein AAFO94_05750 [Bacteroidota bacterium]